VQEHVVADDKIDGDNEENSNDDECVESARNSRGNRNAITHRIASEANVWFTQKQV
jgi:hypothetical protein